VQYYSTHHRSLYPHIATARQHYFFTSHAGSPVCCWDLRRVRKPQPAVPCLSWPRRRRDYSGGMVTTRSRQEHEHAGA